MADLVAALNYQCNFSYVCPIANRGGVSAKPNVWQSDVACNLAKNVLCYKPVYIDQAYFVGTSRAMAVNKIL